MWDLEKDANPLRLSIVLSHHMHMNWIQYLNTYWYIFIHHQQDINSCWWKQELLQAVQKTYIFILLMMNKSNKIRIRFSKYLMYWYIWVNLKSKFVFFTTKSSRTGHKKDNFYDIRKLVRILLENLIKRCVQNFESIGWKLFHLCCQPI